MTLRIRCPECKTILRVPAGIKPVCPKCGFAGKSARAAKQAAAAEPTAADAGLATPAPGGGNVEWAEESQDVWQPVEEPPKKEPVKFTRT